MQIRPTARAAAAAAVAAAAILAATTAGAVPRYSARYEQNCALCHVNPTGGGQRSLYAAQYLVPAEIAARASTPEEMERIDPRIGKNLSVGADLRTIYHIADEVRTETENFIQMEGSVDLTFDLGDRFLAHVGRGMVGSTEVYGVGYLLPWHGYLKVGRFVPALGWRFADHTLFVRQKPWFASDGVSDLGGRPATLTDVGLEAGFFPGRGELTFAVLNGNRRGTTDDDGEVAAASRALYRGRVGPVGFGAGGSFWHNHEPRGIRRAGGPFGYALVGPLAWLAEADWSRGPAAGRQDRVTHLTSSHQVSVLVRRGLELLGSVDLHDPDVDLRSGAAARYTAGVQYTPYPFVSLSAAFEAYRFEKGALVAADDYNQIQGQVHLFY